MSKGFLHLHFAVNSISIASISGFDLKNEKLRPKQKYLIKDMAIPILILFRFCLGTVH